MTDTTDNFNVIEFPEKAIDKLELRHFQDQLNESISKNDKGELTALILIAVTGEENNMCFLYDSKDISKVVLPLEVLKNRIITGG